jgi:hypothetical protein
MGLAAQGETMDYSVYKVKVTCKDGVVHEATQGSCNVYDAVCTVAEDLHKYGYGPAQAECGKFKAVIKEGAVIETNFRNLDTVPEGWR